jgi:hypothetical protein
MAAKGRQQDHYEVLGVIRAAPDEVIRAAYRALAAKYHPDRNQGDGDAELKLKRLNAAYRVVGDPEKRKQYDELTWGPEDHDEPPKNATPSPGVPGPAQQVVDDRPQPHVDVRTSRTGGTKKHPLDNTLGRMFAALCCGALARYAPGWMKTLDPDVHRVVDVLLFGVLGFGLLVVAIMASRSAWRVRRRLVASGQSWGRAKKWVLLAVVGFGLLGAIIGFSVSYLGLGQSDFEDPVQHFADVWVTNSDGRNLRLIPAEQQADALAEGYRLALPPPASRKPHLQQATLWAVCGAFAGCSLPLWGLTIASALSALRSRRRART